MSLLMIFFTFKIDHATFCQHRLVLVFITV